MKNSIKHVLAVSTVAFSLLGSQVYAKDHDHMGRGLAHAEWSQQKMQSFAESLKLNANQQKLWSAAQKSRQDAWAQLKEERQQFKQQRQALIAKDDFHPKQLASLEDAWHTKMRAARVAQRDAWFTLYDSLNAEQRRVFKEAMYQGKHKHHRGHK